MTRLQLHSWQETRLISSDSKIHRLSIMKLISFLNTTTDVIVLALLYTTIGILTSFILHYLFDEFDQEWKKRSPLYHIADVTLEISLLAIVSFWSSVVITYVGPLFPVTKSFGSLIDSYVSSTFFLFAIFVFMDDLSAKLQHINLIHLAPIFDEIFPMHGSIVDMSLTYKKK